ncbi:MAG: hypothetical protein RR280_01070 [Bacteroidaceae bacterium]
MINNKEYEIPEGFVLLGTPMIENLEVGDIALFRDGDQRPVEFVATLPHDMVGGYANVIGVKGYEPWACTDDLKFEADTESSQDIVGILICREGKELIGSGSTTFYTVMCCYSNGHPCAFITPDGNEYTDADDGDIHYFTVQKEAEHMRNRMVEDGVRDLTALLVVEVVKETRVHAVAVEASHLVPVTPAPCPVQVGSELELVDGSIVEVTEVLHRLPAFDGYALGISFKYGEEEQTFWYDRDGFTNHTTALHIKRIKLF